MPKLNAVLKYVSRLTIGGLAVAFVCVSAQPLSAGPFNMFKSKNNQGQTSSQGRGGGGGGLFGGLFNGGSRNAQPQGEVTRSELPTGDPEVAMILNPGLGSPTLSRGNIAASKTAIQQYSTIVAQGGWPMVPGVAMKPGRRGNNIQTLQRRLQISGDLMPGYQPGRYDNATVAAVKRFQYRHGLPATGVVDSKATVAALNVPASTRLAQLQASLKRLQRRAGKTTNRYIQVNIPAAQVEAVRGGRVELRNTAVVGKVQHQTPTLSSKVSQVKFNPYWNVPTSIVKADLIPKGRQFASRGQDMLAAYRMEAIDRKGNIVDPRMINWNSDEVYTYRYRQKPWEENSLGYIKIDFPNKEAVYIHDTPLKSLFGKAVRFESHGCVRTHNVDRLAAWVLDNNPSWNLGRIQSMKNSRVQENVPSRQTIGVYFTYISAWGTPDGLIHFRPDIYNLDTRGTFASNY
ncbi:MAG: L,D-transpeptidase family protein [Methyloceanibacter sp.]|jgi:murein L,D-transpeptidase YcbB/YkuD|uniref:L,D-transpeptidase family protein n=1 Tax=Methyloceanibacter sp. TaxID=1965321 RepID=UPI003C332A97